MQTFIFMPHIFITGFIDKMFYRVFNSKNNNFSISRSYLILFHWWNPITFFCKITQLCAFWFVWYNLRATIFVNLTIYTSNHHHRNRTASYTRWRRWRRHGGCFIYTVINCSFHCLIRMKVTC